MQARDDDYDLLWHRTRLSKKSSSILKRSFYLPVQQCIRMSKLWNSEKKLKTVGIGK